MEQGQHWKGKLCYAYGTSLTSATWGNYIPWLAKLSGLQIVNKGIPAEGITNLGGYNRALSLWYQLRQVPLFISAIPKGLPLPEGCPSMKTPPERN